MPAETVLVSGAFDDLRSSEVRFLQEAARSGDVHVLLWSDDTIRLLEQREPKFPAAERQYFLESLRYIRSVEVDAGLADPDILPERTAACCTSWAVRAADSTPEKQAYARQTGLEYRVIPDSQLRGFPTGPFAPPDRSETGRKQVMVTGTFDWLHTGHVRFFEEVSGYGDLSVVVGHDANIELLKGPGHPLYPQDERLYMVGAIRCVAQALLSTGHGWLDAEPELARLKPDIYAVNKDGDKPEKRAYCAEHGIEYLVLKRIPKEGLAKRSSTDLRGF